MDIITNPNVIGIYENIFSHLKVEDIVNLGRTSKKWNQITEEFFQRKSLKRKQLKSETEFLIQSKPISRRYSI